MRCCEKGRSMVEMLGVLAIVGILSMGAIGGYAKATAKMKKDRLVYQISEFVINIRALFFQQADFSNISASLLVRSGAVPNGMYDPAEINNANPTLRHIFSGQILIYPSNKYDDTRKMAFEMYLLGLTKDACIAMATTDWGQDPASGFVSMYIGTDEFTEPLMQNVYASTDNNEEAGIYTPGQHSLAVPLPINPAFEACACPGNQCVVGLKYI